MKIELKEAYYYRKLKNKEVVCELCPHNCLLRSGQSGLCRVRKNYDGTLYALSYGRCAITSIESIESEHIYHFIPGSDVMSVGTIGCNFKCDFCQNWKASQKSANTEFILPKDLVKKAQDNKVSEIIFTYNEPIVWFEYVIDTAKLCKAAGIKAIMFTNAFINKEPLEELLPFIDAMNIDVKAFDNIFYEKICNGTLANVIQTIETVFNSGTHLEVTNPIIPTLNDTKEHMSSFAEWLSSLSKNIPLHLLRYFPNYKREMAATDVDNLLRIFKIAKKYLNFVYLGNILDIENSSTVCSKCGTVAIKRVGFNVDIINKSSKCINCGYDLNIIFE